MNDLEDLLVRTLRDPARVLPAPADPVPAIAARARSQRRRAALGAAAVVLATVAALVVPMTLRTATTPPPAAPAPASAPNTALLDWAPRGPLAGDEALVTGAERAWRDGGARRPAGAVSVLWAGTVRGRRTVLMQGRDRDRAALLGLVSGDPQRVVRVDPLPDPGIIGVRVTVGTGTGDFLLIRPDAGSVWVLEEWGVSGVEEKMPADGVVVTTYPSGFRYAVSDTRGQVLADGLLAEDGSLPLARGPIRMGPPTWRRTTALPMGDVLEVGRTLADRLGGGTGPIEVAALQGSFGRQPAEKPAGRYVSSLYEVRRGGRTWLSAGVQDRTPGKDVPACTLLTEITGRVAATHALVSRCRPAGEDGGALFVHLADGVRVTGVTLEAAGPGQRPFRWTGDSADDLGKEIRAGFPAGPGRVTLVDARGNALPAVEVPPYS